MARRQASVTGLVCPSSGGRNAALRSVLDSVPETVARKIVGTLTALDATPTINLRADLNAEDDEGRWWTVLRAAADPAAVVSGAVLVAGTERFWSVVRIEQVDDDGQVLLVAVPPDDPAAVHLLAGSA